MTVMPILDRSKWPPAAVTYCRSLEAENARLWSRNHYLEQALGFTLQAPPELGLTPSQAAVLGMLTRREAVSKEAMHLMLCERSKHGGPDIGVLTTVIFHLRRKLKPYGIEIANIYGQGYRIAPAYRAKAREIMGSLSA